MGGKTVPWPAGHAAGDYAILVGIQTNISDTGAVDTLSVPSGFRLFGTATSTDAVDVRITAWWNYATGSSMVPTVISSSGYPGGGHSSFGRMFTFSGASNEGPDSWSSNGNRNTVDFVASGSTTHGSGELVGIIASRFSTDGTPPGFTISGWTNADLTGLAENSDTCAGMPDLGAQSMGLALATATKPLAGSFGPTTATWTSDLNYGEAGLAFCLRSAAAPGHVYSGSVDATSGWACPANAAEWGDLVFGTDIPVPDGLWSFQDAAGNLVDSLGGGAFTMGVIGTPHYQQSFTGWTRKGILFDDGDNDLFRVSLGADHSVMMLAFVSLPASVGGTTRSVMTLGNGFGQQFAANTKPSSNPTELELVDHGGVGGKDGTTTSAGVHPIIVGADMTAQVGYYQTDLETRSRAFAGGDHPNGLAFGGDNVNYWFAPAMTVLYGVVWQDAKAEMTAAQRAQLIMLLKNGH